ncbi:MAG: flagellar assembly peptidoglycan hydrolase FlgJ [Sulfurimicrobium sp.]|nr:flagellar assembly peptidoglycan hydrolase FlgJ [Sulfurimicrobium sp.]MDP1704885.1 flagellar assembly peptidoglycan hydrolase FlgJ [Sulfurimicrobium sp.]MDP2199166.1 flagellar assembly peptidoglycan hydrolase FlgJ [Sulfurimicrobium sp.]
MISSISDISSRLAIDAQSVGQLRLQVKNDPVAGARAAAQQFEALFLNMMLKSMREATPQDGLFDDSNTRLYTGMLDSQLAQSLSKGKGIGLADMLVRQMQIQGVIPNNLQANDDKAASGKIERQLLPHRIEKPFQSGQLPVEQSSPEAGGVPDILSNASTKAGFTGPADFVNTLWPHAADAAQKLGVPTHFVLGQAALESGWGKREIRDALGNNSHNLFGIKAGKGWNGAVMEAQTTEYVNGVAQKKTELFRAYDSYAEGLKDYASLLKNNPRYASMLAQPLDASGFARGLQQAGYATDPMYADKLARVINSDALRQALS